MTMHVTGADRRAFGRRPTYQHAVAHMPGRVPLRCVVRDISKGGALLEFGEPVTLPYRIRLVWDGSGQQADCEVRHVQGVKAGVQFTCAEGPRIAAQSVALNSGGPLPPEAPALDRKAVEKLSIALVHKFRMARQPAGQPSSVDPAVAPAVSEPAIAFSIPLPLAARLYATSP